MRHHRRASQSSLLLNRWQRRKYLSAFSLLGLLGVSLHSNVVAQQSTAQPRTAIEKVNPGPYVDRVMEGLAAEDSLELKPSEFNASGWPRSWRVDYSLFTQQSEARTDARALTLVGFVDTPNYGSISANSSMVSQQLSVLGQSTTTVFSTVRIDQRAMPLAGGWRANHSAGDINTGLTTLSRGSGRVSLPSTPVRGLAGQWSLGEAVDIHFSTGQVGLFNGVNTPGFETTKGSISSAGAQARLPIKLGDSKVDAAMQLIDGRKLSEGGTLIDTQSVWMSAAWAGTAPWTESAIKPGAPPADRPGGLRVQANLVHTSSTQTGTEPGRATGFWSDASWRTERWRNSAGVFRLEPSLRWGSALLASDLQGAYWQTDTATRQWQLAFSTELTDRVSSNSTGSASSGKSAFFNVNGRYILDSSNNLGASLNLRAASSPGQSVQLTWNQLNDWGQTQWRTEFAKASEAQTQRAGLDHTWAVVAPASFVTSLGLERATGGMSPNNGLTWGLLGTVTPLSQWSLDAALRGETRSNGTKSIDANVGVNWQAFNGWSLGLRYTESSGRTVQENLVTSALTTATLPVVVATPRNRSMQLVLRYSGRAGSASAPLGGAVGGGAGSLFGTVFFDADWNGKREATEGGVANVTVVLDKRYITRTDAQGRYEFPSVAEGFHTLEVSSDNVPLPWSPQLREPIRIQIGVRESTVQDFAVQRDR